MSWTKRLTAREPTSSHDAGSLTRAEYLLAGAVVMVVLLVVWSSQFVHATPAVYRIAQFAHLTCVVIGLGSVLVVDWYGLRWQWGRASLESVVATAGALTIPIWFGLSGLLLSGVFLEPNLTSPLTRVKIGFVMIAGVVGILALATKRGLSSAGHPRPNRLIHRAMILAVASQICWWGATLIGFLNRT
jgi:hypothetical protein